MPVSNLPPDTSESDLLEMLEEVGGIRSLQILGQGGLAVCDFFDPAAAGVARRSVDGSMWHEAKLTVRYTYELSAQQRQPPNLPAAPGADNNDPDVMNVDTVDAENNTETFAAERTISRIVENLPELNVDITNTDALSRRFSELTSEQTKEILYAAKDAAMIDSKVLKDVLLNHPSLTRALFESQLNLDLVKVPQDRGVEVESLLQQLLTMLKPKPPPRKPSQTPKQVPQTVASVQGTSGRQSSKGGPRNRCFAQVTKRTRGRHHPERNHHQQIGHVSARSHQTKHASFASTVRGQTQFPRPQPTATSMQAVIKPRNIQLPQSIQNYTGTLVHKPQMGQVQAPNQITLQHPVQIPQQGAGNIRAPLGGVIAGNMVVNPLQQQQQQPQHAIPQVVQQGNIFLNQVQVASHSQVPMTPGINQPLPQGAWIPQDLSALHPARPPFAVPSIDNSGVYEQRNPLNTGFGNVSVNQLAQQGWIVRPQVTPQQQIVLGPSQTVGASFPGNLQASRTIQGVTTDINQAQMAGVWNQARVQQAVEDGGLVRVWRR